MRSAALRTEGRFMVIAGCASYRRFASHPSSARPLSCSPFIRGPFRDLPITPAIRSTKNFALALALFCQNLKRGTPNT